MATVAAALRNMMRRGVVRPARPADGSPGGAVTVKGTVNPAGTPVQVAWGRGYHTPPVSGWSASAKSDGQGRWTADTGYPAAGTWYLWARRADHTAVCAPAGPVRIV